MKKVSSVVWQFFDRLVDNKRCVAVLCKLCDTEYKYFGNTTNLRAHLVKKHPLQWEFRQNNLDAQKLEEQPLIRAYEEDDNTSLTESVSTKRRKYSHSSSNQNVDTLENSEVEIEQVEVDEDATTLNLVRQMHDNQGSDEEWLDDDYVLKDVYEPAHKKVYKKIKREAVSPSCLSTPYIPQHSVKHQRPQKIVIDDSKKDEYSVFGEYIANKIRKFKSPKTRGNIQQIITTVLWQAEYGMYDDAESVKRVIMSSDMQYGDGNQQTSEEVIQKLTSEHYTQKNVDDLSQEITSEGESYN